jgi:hypothetical protein
LLCLCHTILYLDIYFLSDLTHYILYCDGKPS